jgi:hypothetical protein
MLVSVTSDEYTAARYMVTVNASTTTIKSGQLDLGNIIPVFKTKNDPLTGTISGRVTYQSDLTNTTREIVPAGTRIVATIDATDATFYDTYLTVKKPYILDSLQSGKIIQFAYEAAYYDSTDAQGNYRIVVPTAVEGLPFKLAAPDLAATQKYFENASAGGFNTIKTARTLYAQSQTPSSIPPAGGAAVTFISGSGATAVANISGAGQIDRINITNGGAKYNGAPRVIISGGGGSGAEATAQVTNGVVTSITVTNAGTGYVSAPTITLNSGSGASFTASIGGTGSVRSITVLNSGAGYTSAPSVTIASPPTGTTATGVAVLTNGKVSSITLTNPGSGYTTTPTVVIADAPTGGINATAVSQFSGLSVQSVSLGSPGSGYTAPPTVTFSEPQVSGGVRAAGTVTLDAGGSVTGMAITNAGSGYTSDPVVTLSAGSGAAAEAVFSGRIVTGITLMTAGDDYTSPPAVKITGGGGSGATATAVISNGRVTGFNITNAGSGYMSAPSVELTSGKGAEASVQVDNGGISTIQVVNGGHGYTGAPLVVISTVPSTGPGGGATATATVNAAGEVTGVTITTPGTGYIGGNVPSVAEPFSITPASSGNAITTKPGGMYIRDVHFGTGMRLPD